MRRGWILLAVLAFVLAAGVGAIAFLALRRPDYSPRKTPPTVEQEARLLEAELPLASTRKPYLILDLVSSRLIYRISGMTPKEIPFRIDSIRGPGGWLLPDPDSLAILVLEGRGAPREVIRPPDPDKPVDPLKDPKIFPPDPPSDYILSFDRPVKVRIVGEKDTGWKDRLGSLKKAVRQWLGMGKGRGGLRIQLRLPAERAQEIYRGLYHGEKLLLLGLKEPSPQAPLPRADPPRRSGKQGTQGP